MTQATPLSDAITRSQGTPWKLRQPYTVKHVAILCVLFVVLGWSFQHVELTRAVRDLGQAAGYAVGLSESSQVATGAQTYIEKGWPLVFARETPVLRIENFDRNELG